MTTKDIKKLIIAKFKSLSDFKSHENDHDLQDALTFVPLTVGVYTGTVTHNGYIPLPEGVDESECTFFVSMNNNNKFKESWDIDEAGTHFHFRSECWIEGKRKVHVGMFIGHADSQHGTRFIPGIANYLIVVGG